MSGGFGAVACRATGPSLTPYRHSRRLLHASKAPGSPPARACSSAPSQPACCPTSGAEIEINSRPGALRVDHSGEQAASCMRRNGSCPPPFRWRPQGLVQPLQHQQRALDQLPDHQARHKQQSSRAPGLEPRGAASALAPLSSAGKTPMPAGGGWDAHETTTPAHLTLPAFPAPFGTLAAPGAGNGELVAAGSARAGTAPLCSQPARCGRGAGAAARAH